MSMTTRGRRVYLKPTICLQHDAIIALARTLLKNPTQEQLLSRAERIIMFAENARTMGKKMEVRLEQYRTGIEAMGFKRRKKK